MVTFRNLVLVGVAAGAIAMAGCNAAPPAVAEEAKAETVAASAFVAAPGGTVETIQPVPEDDPGEANDLAGVVKFDVVPNQTDEASPRLIGTAGGDPAANGLMTYLVFSTMHSSKVFLIGNIIDYRIIGASPGKLDLEIDETTADNDGNLGSATRKVIVSWTPVTEDQGPDTEFTSAVTVTPAQ